MTNIALALKNGVPIFIQNKETGDELRTRRYHGAFDSQ
jgi:hypothetical protein